MLTKNFRTRASRSRKLGNRQARTRTRFLLTRLKEQSNAGKVDPDLVHEIDDHFRTLWKLRMKS